MSLQVRGHGAPHDAGQDSGRGVLAVRRAGHRTPGPSHRLQLLQVTQQQPGHRTLATSAANRL